MELRGLIFWVLSRTPLSFFFSTAIEVERSDFSMMTIARTLYEIIRIVYKLSYR